MAEKLKKPKPLKWTPGEKLLLKLRSGILDRRHYLRYLDGVGPVAFREAKKRRWVGSAKRRSVYYPADSFYLTRTGQKHLRKLHEQQKQWEQERSRWRIQQLGPCGFCGESAQQKHPARPFLGYRCTNEECELACTMIPEALWRAIGKLGRQLNTTKGNPDG